MPGLIGLVRLNDKPVEPEVFNKLCRLAVTRNSFQIDRYLQSAPTMALAHVHCATSRNGVQPAISPGGEIQLVLEGEVYNEDVDPHDQAASLLRAYLKEGANLFDRLNGHFLLALAEPDAHRLTLVADRTASIPLFYTRCGDLLAFSPTLQPLTSLLGFNPKINPLAVSNFLSTGCILEGKCLVDNIELLHQGQVLVVEGSEVRVRNYWKFSYTDQRDERSEEILADELADLVFQAVRRQTRDEANIAISLSGGYDSRSILCALRRLYPDRPIRTISWGDPSNHPNSDIKVAERLAQHFRTEHSFFPLNSATLPDHFREFVLASEGRIDAVGNYPHALSTFERIHNDLNVEVLIRGNEFFGCKAKVSRYSAALYNAYLPTMSLLPESFPYLKPDVRRRLVELGNTQAARLEAVYPYDDLTDYKDQLYISERFYGYQNPLTQLKRQVLEERNPLLDNDVIEFVRRLPPQLRVWKKLFKITVRQMMPEFDQIGISQVNNLVDWDSRLQTDGRLQEFIRRTLLETSSGFDQLVDLQALSRFLETAFRRHRKVPDNLARRLYRKFRQRMDWYELPRCEEIFRLMILKIWVEECMNGNFDLV